MATTNRNVHIGTALVVADHDRECDFCGKIIPAGTEHAADFVNCCIECDKAMPCGWGEPCNAPVLDNHNYCAKHQGMSGEGCGCPEGAHSH